MDEPKEWDWLTVFGVVAAVAIAMGVAPALNPQEERDIERGRWERLRAYARSIEARERAERTP